MVKVEIEILINIKRLKYLHCEYKILKVPKIPIRALNHWFPECIGIVDRAMYWLSDDIIVNIGVGGPKFRYISSDLGRYLKP